MPAKCQLGLDRKTLLRILEVQGISMGLNYGVNKVRFPSPVTVGSRLRAGAQMVSAEEIPGGVQTVIVITIEREGGDKPACVIEAVSRWLE